MSYWVSLHDKKTNDVLEVPSFEAGGTYVQGGSNEADLNVTYNYSKFFNFRSLHDRKAKDTIKEIAFSVLALGTERDLDYWKATKGNVGYALRILMRWAKQYPDGIWKVN